MVVHLYRLNKLARRFVTELKYCLCCLAEDRIRTLSSSDRISILPYTLLDNY